MSITYRICRILRCITRKKRPHTVAILLAGGVGSRMQTRDGRTKQLLPLAGEPILVHTARAFAASPYIDEIVIVTRKEERAEVESLVQEYGIAKIRCIVSGGSTRQLSALAGFEAIDGERTAFVAIHDAARCLITPAMIDDVVAAAYADRAAIAACRVHDTVKQANSDGYITATTDRERLWFAQTPQVFAADLYRAAAYTAMKANFTATDDAMLCERIGQRVKLVDCGDENFKITTQGDLLRAEAVLHRRREEGEEKE